MKCEICDSTKIKRLLEFKDYNAKNYPSSLSLEDRNFSLVKCKNCNHYYIADKVSEDMLDEIYGSSSHVGEETYSNPENIECMKQLASIFAESISIESPKKGAFFEIGASHGELLLSLKSLGWSVSGIEPSVNGVASCTKKGLDVKRLSLEGYHDNINIKYDCIGTFSVFEHLYDVHEGMKKVIKMLRPNGGFYIEVPSIDSVHYKIKGIKFIKSSVANQKGIFHPVEHVRYFSKTSLKALLDMYFVNVDLIDDPRYGRYYRKSFLKDFLCFTSGATKSGNLVAFCREPKFTRL